MTTSDTLQVPTDAATPPPDLVASSSSSTLPPPTLSLLPSNVVSIFLARFHVRHGNQIEFQWPPPASTSHASAAHSAGSEPRRKAADEAETVDLSGVEWKVLPSGGHLIERDTVYFQPSRLDAVPSASPARDRRARVGVACFRNVKLDAAASSSSSSPLVDAAASSSAASSGGDGRGARMVSVGLVLSCHASEAAVSPTAHQLAIVPHLDNLEKLADRLALHPERTDLLRDYYRAHAVKRAGGKGQPDEDEKPMSAHKSRQLRMRRRRDPKNLYHDPTSHLPAMCSALGPLLPAVLKKLMVQGHRLLIFAPAPPLVQAAYIGYNLADLVMEASPRSKRGDASVPIRVRGQVGVHDIPSFEDEERARKAHRTPASYSEERDRQPLPSWIAWSSDKILLEKPHLFDTVLDLSTLVSPSTGGHLHEDSLIETNGFAKLLRVRRTAVGDPAHPKLPLVEKAEIKKQSWTTREFATFNELDAQAERHADRLVLLGGRKRHVSKRKASKSSLRKASEDGRSPNSTISKRKARRLGPEHSDDDEAEVELLGQRSAHLLRSERSVTQWRGGSARSPRRTRDGVTSTILTFLRYWLAGWWFLPSHWRYTLPSSYVLPLGIRGDGGVRSSIMILPLSESEDEVKDEDDDASDDSETVEGEQDRDAKAGDAAAVDVQKAPSPTKQKGGQQAVPAAGVQDGSKGAETDQGTSTVTDSTESTVSTREDDDDGEGDLDLGMMGPPDPLLAAVGASVPYHHHHHSHDGRRLSVVSSGDEETTRSANGSSGRVTPSRRTVGSVSSGTAGRRGFDRRLSLDRYGNHIPLSSSSIRGADDGDDEDEDGDEEEGPDWSLVLSDSLWTVWNRWTRALVQGLAEILQEERERALTAPASGSDAERRDDEERRRLLDGSRKDSVTVKIGHREMASLGLSAGNDWDVELVQSLGRKVLEKLDRAEGNLSSRKWNVEVDKVWPLFKWFL